MYTRARSRLHPKQRTHDLVHMSRKEVKDLHKVLGEPKYETPNVPTFYPTPVELQRTKLALEDYIPKARKDFY